MFEKTQRSIGRASVAGDWSRQFCGCSGGACVVHGVSVRGASVGEESKAGEAIAGVYAGLLIFAAVIIGAATMAPSGK